MKNMDKNLVFFAENGLTSTSANHIANMAKESIADLERNISSINFVTKSVSLIGTDAEHVVKRGWSKDLLDTLPEKIKQITEMKSLCAWLREAIKARDNMLNDVRRMNIVKYREEIEGQPYENPRPEHEDPITRDDVIAQMSIGDREKYYTLETRCAVLGKVIHESMPLSAARKDLADKIENSEAVTGNGRDAIISRFTATISQDDVDKMFFALQAQYRSYQAELNKMKHEIELILTQDAIDKETKYKNALQAYNTYDNELVARMAEWQKKETARISALKIIIPDRLKQVYESVKELTKK
jgi:hypothetical protein